MPVKYLMYFELFIGVVTACLAFKKKRNPVIWLILGTGFSLIALAVILEMPYPRQPDA